MLSQGLINWSDQYPNLAVIGAYWGDEGKGKITDLLMPRFDIDVRFSGAHNAGHSVQHGIQGFAFHVLPSGFASGRICIIAGGVILKIEALVDEITTNTPLLSCEPPKVLIDERCALWTPYSPLIEAYLEQARGNNAIGTTLRGVGPTRALYDLREGLIAAHLLDEDKLVRDLTRMHRTLSPIMGDSAMIPDPSVVARDLLELVRRHQLSECIIDTGAYLFDAIKQGQRVLFEGAQATLLSIDSGTWPFVTSTSSVAGGIASGTRLPPGAVSGVVCVSKFFNTRVGGGPMPGELSTRKAIQEFGEQHPKLFSRELADQPSRDDWLTQRLRWINSGEASSAEVGEFIMVQAREKGVSTGRGRSTGRPNIPLLQYAVRINDPNVLALTCLDIASGMSEVEVVTGHRYRGKELPWGVVPILDLDNVEPIIETWPGWDEDISGITDWKALPQNARSFIERIETAVERSIAFIGTGPDRDHLIFRPPSGQYPKFF